MSDDTLKLGTIKNRSGFLHVREGLSFARPGLVIQMRANPDGTQGIRVGFTATKKIGNAVIRNRAKRRLRALAREILPQRGQPGMDYVFIARYNTAKLPWSRLVGETQKALSRLDEMRIKRKTSSH